MIQNIFLYAKKEQPMDINKQTFLVIYKPGPAWLEGKPLSEQPIQQHGKYMLSLYQTDIMRFAGPFGNNAGGAALINASGEEEAKTIINQDPSVIEGVFIYELFAWTLIPWESYLQK
jgi:uncharacterized protein YciI